MQARFVIRPDKLPSIGHIRELDRDRVRTGIADDMLMPCGPKQPGAVHTTMEELALKGLASKILPPPITRTDFDKVLARQRPTVSKGDLEVHERFTKEFREDYIALNYSASILSVWYLLFNVNVNEECRKLLCLHMHLSSCLHDYFASSFISNKIKFISSWQLRIT